MAKISIPAGIADKTCNGEEINIKNEYPLPADTGIFWYPHVNGASTGIIVSVPVDTRTR